MKQFIICSAIKFNIPKVEALVISGRRHADAFNTWEKLNPITYSYATRNNVICGFIDNYGEFHNREEAYIIADKANQIRFGKGTHDPNEAPLLISEHLFDDLEE